MKSVGLGLLIAVAAALSSCGTGFVKGWHQHEGLRGTAEERCGRWKGHLWVKSEAQCKELGAIEDFELTSPEECSAEGDVWVDDHCKRSDKVTETECAAIAGRIWFDKGCRPRDEVACVQDKTKAFVKGSCLDRPTLTLTGATTQSILAGASFAPVAFAVSVGSKVELRPLLCTGYFTTKNGQVVVADATALAAGDVSHCAVALVAISRDTESLPQVMTINFVPGFLSICESATAATATQRQTIDLIEIALKDTNCKSAAAKLFAATDLTLAGKGIADLTPLAGLTGLTSLDLSGNQIVDLAPLADLTGLKSLDLSKNIDLANVSALAALKGLVALNLTDTALQRTPGIKTDANCPVANVGDKLREFCTAR